MKKKTAFIVTLTLSLLLTSMPPLLYRMDNNCKTDGNYAEQAFGNLTQESNDVPEMKDERNNDDQKENRLSFLAVGDNLIHLALTYYCADSSEEDGFNFYPLYEKYGDAIGKADISYINQEVMMDDEKEYSNYPSFNTAQALGDDLYKLGFDVVGVGNNHTLDKGIHGALSTIEKFASLGVVTVGAYKKGDENNIRVIEKNGIRVALLSYTYPGFNGNHFSDDNPYLTIPTLDKEDKILEDISAANEISDITVVFVHWGTENSFIPSPSQKRLAKIMAQHGAGVIIGTHPHVLQDLEWIYNENNERTLCAYSLGNFVSMMSNDYNMLGGVLEFDIVKDENGVYEDNVRLSPCVFYFNRAYKACKVLPLEEFTSEMSESHGVTLYPKSSSVKNIISADGLWNYYFKYVSSEFYPEEYP